MKEEVKEEVKEETVEEDSETQKTQDAAGKIDAQPDKKVEPPKSPGNTGTLIAVIIFIAIVAVVVYLLKRQS